MAIEPKIQHLIQNFLAPFPPILGVQHFIKIAHQITTNQRKSQISCNTAIDAFMSPRKIGHLELSYTFKYIFVS